MALPVMRETQRCRLPCLMGPEQASPRPQNGGPRQCGLDYDRWEQVPPRQAQEIVQIVRLQDPDRPAIPRLSFSAHPAHAAHFLVTEKPSGMP